MVNPVLTILFDLFLIGSALALVSAMTTEYLVSREPHVGSARAARPGRPRPSTRRRAETLKNREVRRRAA
ncbi:MAG TPA: hypothetical protein PKD75_06620 [Tepidiformaceae bacterium]|nr:hypothetical protein [Tepidiformaceae bacterium]